MALIVTQPPAGCARLRFVVDDNDPFRLATEWETHTNKATHVEAVVPDGIIGAYLHIGVQLRPIDYDTTSTAQIFADIVMPDVMLKAWDTALRGHITKPYDWLALGGFVAHQDMHLFGHFICSALQAIVLRDCGRIERPLSEPVHQISPRDLLLIVSALPNVIVNPQERGLER
jgi:hypothetical protein